MLEKELIKVQVPATYIHLYSHMFNGSQYINLYICYEKASPSSPFTFYGAYPQTQIIPL